MNRILFWPKVREQIIGHLEDLLDEKNRKTWFSTTAKHRFWDSLDFYIFDYLIDGVHLYSEAHKGIGISLYNKEEADSIEKYLEFYQDTFEGEMPDSYYINHQEWSRLLRWTRDILDMMEVNNKKYNYENEIKKWDDMQDRQNEMGLAIYEEIDKIDSFSAEEKQEMKRRIFVSGLDEFDNIANDILEKIKSAKNT